MFGKKRKMESAKSGSSLASMIDVVFLLLFFFVATFVPQKVEAHLAINHPSSGGPGKSGPMLEVQVRPEGYMLMDRWQSLEDIEDKLITVNVLDEDMPVFVKVHPSATEGQLVRFLDICGKLGITNLNVLTLKE